MPPKIEFLPKDTMAATCLTAPGYAAMRWLLGRRPNDDELTHEQLLETTMLIAQAIDRSDFSVADFPWLKRELGHLVRDYDTLRVGFVISRRVTTQARRAQIFIAHADDDGTFRVLRKVYDADGALLYERYVSFGPAAPLSVTPHSGPVEDGRVVWFERTS
jgi:hypothetical protein